MRRSSFVPCDDPLAGIFTPAVATPAGDESTPKEEQESNPKTSAARKQKTESPDNTIADFGDSAWLQDPFIRMPVRRKPTITKRTAPRNGNSSDFKLRREQEEVRESSKPHRLFRTRAAKRDKTFDAQLAGDVRTLPNGDVMLLPGEVEALRLPDEVLWPHTAGLVEIRGAGPSIPPSERIASKGKGVFVTTNYRLYFLRKRTEKKWQLDPLTHVPLGEIDRAELKENRSYGRRKGAPPMWLELGCKGVRIIRFGFRTERTCESAHRLISEFAFANIDLAFAFQYKLDIPIPPMFDGWKIYDARKDYERVGIPDNMWRISEANVNYKLCSTYPRYLVVPSTISDEDLHSIAKFRSRCRIPVCVWRDVRTGATIWRCSQPKVGIQYARNKSDEELLERIHRVNGGKKLIIFDARPLKNALANKAVGKGYEESSYYRNTEVKFMNIENIHRVRESFQQARNAVLNCSADSDNKFFAKFEQSGWLKHIRTILKATYEMVARVKVHGASIVSHCSDGWDRTAQLIASVELCLDPHYRSIDGFFCLIEKEWLSFGHQFQKRLGHMIPSGDQDISPVFVQWLDSVWQIMRQHPTAFEFNSRMLAQIAYHATSLRFGTFLHDFDKERTEQKLATKTVSLWTYLKASTPGRKGDFTNPFYAPQKGLVLYPAWDHAHLHVWSDFWLEHSYSSTLVQVMKDRLPPYTVHESQLPGKPHAEKMIHSVGHAIRNQLGAQIRKRQQAEKENKALKAEIQELKALLKEQGILTENSSAEADVASENEGRKVATTSPSEASGQLKSPVEIESRADAISIQPTAGTDVIPQSTQDSNRGEVVFQSGSPQEGKGDQALKQKVLGSPKGAAEETRIETEGTVDQVENGKNDAEDTVECTNLPESNSRASAHGIDEHNENVVGSEIIVEGDAKQSPNHSDDANKRRTPGQLVDF